MLRKPKENQADMGRTCKLHTEWEKNQGKVRIERTNVLLSGDGGKHRIGKRRTLQQSLVGCCVQINIEKVST